LPKCYVRGVDAGIDDLHVAEDCASCCIHDELGREGVRAEHALGNLQELSVSADDLRTYERDVLDTPLESHRRIREARQSAPAMTYVLVSPV
jgi:hypothetical protein